MGGHFITIMDLLSIISWTLMKETSETYMKYNYSQQSPIHQKWLISVISTPLITLSNHNPDTGFHFSKLLFAARGYRFRLSIPFQENTSLTELTKLHFIKFTRQSNWNFQYDKHGIYVFQFNISSQYNWFQLINSMWPPVPYAPLISLT